MGAAKGTVLVLEDNTQASQLYVDTLKSYGFMVRLAKGIPEAMQIADDEVVDVVVLDMFVGGDQYGGLQCTEIVDARKCVLVSGYIDDHALAEAGKKGINTIILKPFDVMFLVETVQMKAAENRLLEELDDWKENNNRKHMEIQQFADIIDKEVRCWRDMNGDHGEEL